MAQFARSVLALLLVRLWQQHMLAAILTMQLDACRCDADKQCTCNCGCCEPYCAIGKLQMQSQIASNFGSVLANQM